MIDDVVKFNYLFVCTFYFLENMDVDDPEDNSDDGGTNSKKASDYKCFFCDQSRKRKRGTVLKMTAEPIGENTITLWKSIALTADDREMLEKVNQLSIDQLIFFHKPCKYKFIDKKVAEQRKAQEADRVQSESSQYRDIHDETFTIIESYIRDVICNKKKPQLLESIRHIYKTAFEKLFFKKYSAEIDCEYSERNLLSKLKKKITSIQIIVVKKRKIVAPRGEFEVDLSTLHEMIEKEFAEDFALKIRDELRFAPATELPDKFGVEDLIAGECEVPETVSTFIRNVICGATVDPEKSQNCSRKVNSICQDLLYATRNGRVKPSKHICLGLLLKSITSSRKVVDIVNKFGHCCSYNVIEGLETESTFSASRSATLCPEGVQKGMKYFTSVAFDNFDRYVETTNGKDTLHDTVGILIQNIVPSVTLDFDNSDRINDDNLDLDISSDSRDFDDFYGDNDRANERTRRKRMRRTFHEVAEPLEKYLKPTKCFERLLPLNDPKRLVTVPDKTFIDRLDFLWVLSHHCKVENSSLWAGFNSKVLKDDSPQQKIFYLTPINHSPTSPTVVYETMRQAQVIANECEQDEILVTYDLAIAKIAMQIKSQENSSFSKLFIGLGTFHIQLALNKANGTFIADSGLTDVMVDCELLASGSVNGLISGKHFNRCKRLHPLVSLALQRLHFESFLKDEDVEISEDFAENIEKILSGEVTAELLEKNENKEVVSIMEKYFMYKQRTMKGEHGKTAQFFMMHIQNITNYLLLSRSIRSGNFNLLKYVLYEICNLFFVFNQINYARWLLKYHENLLNIAETHPKIAAAFNSGLIGSKRTPKPFSRSPFDLTMEQTYNADAGSKLTGISHFTNSISARIRWSKSSRMRTSVATHVYEQLGLKRELEGISDLQPSKMKKDCSHIQVLMDEIKKNINPFDHENLDKEFLFNIRTGKPATEEVSNFLLNAQELGRIKKEEFITACSEDEKRFERPIKKTKVLNFSKMNIKKKSC